MWLIAGTVPEAGLSPYANGLAENCRVEGESLLLPDGRSLPVSRGTTALAATAIRACEALGAPPPHLLLTGDYRRGDGSRAAYSWLAEHLPEIAATQKLAGITFHYFYPDVDNHNRLYMILEELRPKPVLVADAGFMYVAKMSGYAASYDLFTPDIGELAFLADEQSPHPFYTRGFLLAKEDDVPDLLERASRHANCPPNMIIKGKKDYIICDGELKAVVAEPSLPAMECIGGTGDIVTGFVTAFLAAGYSICESSLLAARAARCLAEFCRPNPATQVGSLIANIKAMLAEYRESILSAPNFQ